MLHNTNIQPLQCILFPQAGPGSDTGEYTYNIRQQAPLYTYTLSRHTLRRQRQKNLERWHPYGSAGFQDGYRGNWAKARLVMECS